MKKKLYCIILSLAMVITMMPAMSFTAYAAGDHNDNWGYLSNAMTGNAQVSVPDVIQVTDNSPEAGTRTIKLLTDITAGADDTYLNVSNSPKVILDLNGHTIDRGLTEKDPKSDGFVIRVSSNAYLTVTDNTLDEPGKITGGNSSGDCGAIYVYKSTLLLEKGVITGNHAYEGGGAILLDTDANFVMNGGTISDNSAGKAGGAIYVNNGTKFIMNDGAITGNKALSNSAFSNNSNNGYGGAVYVDDSGSVTLLGGSITENHAKNCAGGVGCNCSITVGGKINISGNTSGNRNNADNVYLRDKRAAEKSLPAPKIIVSTEKPLVSGASIGVSNETEASNISDDSTLLNYLFADNSKYVLKLVEGEIQLVDQSGGGTTQICPMLNLVYKACVKAVTLSLKFQQMQRVLNFKIQQHKAIHSVVSTSIKIAQTIRTVTMMQLMKIQHFML